MRVFYHSQALCVHYSLYGQPTLKFKIYLHWLSLNMQTFTQRQCLHLPWLLGQQIEINILWLSMETKEKNIEWNLFIVKETLRNLLRMSSRSYARTQSKSNISGSRTLFFLNQEGANYYVEVHTGCWIFPWHAIIYLFFNQKFFFSFWPKMKQFLAKKNVQKISTKRKWILHFY